MAEVKVGRLITRFGFSRFQDMKTINFSGFASLLLTLSLLTSCSKGEGTTEPIKTNSREVQFEVSGSFSGDIDASFTTSNGGATIETFASLPWTKTITYAATVQAVGITLGGGEGIAGQSIIIKVFAGGALKSTTTGTAAPSGIVVVAAPTHIF